jgi:hypothetical protein
VSPTTHALVLRSAERINTAAYKAHLQSCNLWRLAAHAHSGAAFVVLRLLTLQDTTAQQQRHVSYEDKPG